MRSTPDPVGTLDVALMHAARLLESNPALAAEQAGEILSVAPGHPVALLYLGVAHRTRGQLAEAVRVLETLVSAHGEWASAHYELGLAYGAADAGEQAIASLRRALELKPDLIDGWRALGDQLMVGGDAGGADAAYARHIKASTKNPRLLECAVALCENRLAVAEAGLRAHLKDYPTDVVAIRMFAEVASRLGRYADAEKLLERCLQLAPTFTAARHNYAVVLHRQSRAVEALREVELLLGVAPENPGYHNLKAAILSRLGEYGLSIETYGRVLEQYPKQPKVWMSYGHALKTAGRREESIQAYRRSIELAPSFGEAYWSLANLKTVRFDDADLSAMRTQLARDDISHEDRFHLHFALGKALEDAGEYADSFEHYALANALRRRGIAYDAAETTAQVRRSKVLFTRELFAERSGAGCDAHDPIFIVSLPRSGSTLIEQILASHPDVEGTMELPDLITMVRKLGERRSRAEVSRYPEILASLPPEELRALGEQYLERTRIQRKTSAPLFIDKMPNNWLHVGLIQLILPNAKIIDARRHPLACCFSNFKQHFARGQHFTYSFEEIAAYYRDYTELMAHFDAVLPGRVHRVYYENMIAHTESEIRALLDYCGLPFAEQCVQFHRNERAVRTASSEQVRKPIYQEGVDSWRHFDAWLAPLKNALGPTLETYPIQIQMGRRQ
jgi:tetratricopeptide (TPR) repeat protein